MATKKQTAGYTLSDVETELSRRANLAAMEDCEEFLTRVTDHLNEDETDGVIVMEVVQPGDMPQIEAKTKNAENLAGVLNAIADVYVAARQKVIMKELAENLIKQTFKDS